MYILPFFTIFIFQCNLCSSLFATRLYSRISESIHGPVNYHNDIYKEPTEEEIGNDIRYSKNETLILEEIERFSNYLQKYKLLQLLENQNISQYAKIEMIQDCFLRRPNIESGGLFDDWNETLEKPAIK